MSDKSYDQWGVEDALLKFSGLRLLPATGTDLKMVGTLTFVAEPIGKERIEDEYQIEIAISKDFPQEIPRVWETGKRIPLSHHKFPNGVLCLGAPPRLSLMILESPTIVSFIEKCVIPYLYGYSYYERHGVMPFGELSHGQVGIAHDLTALFDMHIPDGKEFIRLASMHKRAANKLLCPCGSKRRLGKCHNDKLNELRNRWGRQWFRQQYDDIAKYF